MLTEFARVLNEFADRTISFPVGATGRIDSWHTDPLKTSGWVGRVSRVGVPIRTGQLRVVGLGERSPPMGSVHLSSSNQGSKQGPPTRVDTDKYGEHRGIHMLIKRTDCFIFPIWELEASRYDRNYVTGCANIFHYREPHSENFIFLPIF